MTKQRSSLALPTMRLRVLRGRLGSPLATARRATARLAVVSILIVLISGAFPVPAQAAPDGGLDPTFDTDGKLTTWFGPDNDGAYSIAIQSDGKIVAGGWSNNSNNDDFALARYNSDGSLDLTFDTDGKVTTAIGSGNDVAYSIAIQSDGKIVAGGYSSNGIDSDFALVRYNSDGSLDTTFDTDGKVTTAIGSSNDEAYSIAIQADGKIVVAGSAENGDQGNSNDFALARYNSDGSLDITFDTDGKLTTAFSAFGDFAYSIVIQADGKIVAGGRSYNGNNDDFALARYNSDGSLDPTFDTDGTLTTAIGPDNDYAYSIAIQADGKIVAGGSSYSTTDDFALARYNSDGSLDPTFDTDGTLTTAIGSDNDEVYSIAIQVDGKIVAGGVSDSGTTNDFGLARYNSNGSLDTTFDTDGTLTTPIGPDNDYAYSIAIQADGKIVAGGYSSDGDATDFALARYEVASHVLSITKAGTGTVTSAPAGIDCGLDCAETYGVDTSVTLTAAPGANSTFTGWGGECINVSGTCTVTMDQARSVTATFMSTGGGGGGAPPPTPTPTPTESPSPSPLPTPTEPPTDLTCGGLTVTIQIAAPDLTTLGTSRDDVIRGTTGNDTIHGLDGNDIICGRAGDDTIYGDDRVDTLYGGRGRDKLYGGAGGGGGIYGDSLYGGAGNDLLAGDGGDDLLNGNRGNDHLIGDSGDDRLYGNAGADRLYGHEGDDSLYGGRNTDACHGGEGIDIGRYCEPFSQS